MKKMVRPSKPILVESVTPCEEEAPGVIVRFREASPARFDNELLLEDELPSTQSTPRQGSREIRLMIGQTLTEVSANTYVATGFDLENPTHIYSLLFDDEGGVWVSSTPHRLRSGTADRYVNISFRSGRANTTYQGFNEAPPVPLDAVKHHWAVRPIDGKKALSIEARNKPAGLDHNASVDTFEVDYGDSEDAGSADITLKVTSLTVDKKGVTQASTSNTWVFTRDEIDLPPITWFDAVKDRATQRAPKVETTDFDRKQWAEALAMRDMGDTAEHAMPDDLDFVQPEPEEAAPRRPSKKRLAEARKRLNALKKYQPGQYRLWGVRHASNWLVKILGRKGRRAASWFDRSKLGRWLKSPGKRRYHIPLLVLTILLVGLGASKDKNTDKPANSDETTQTGNATGKAGGDDDTIKVKINECPEDEACELDYNGKPLSEGCLDEEDIEVKGPGQIQLDDGGRFITFYERDGAGKVLRHGKLPKAACEPTDGWVALDGLSKLRKK